MDPIAGLGLIGLVPVLVLGLVWVLIDPEAVPMLQRGIKRLKVLVLGGGESRKF